MNSNRRFRIATILTFCLLLVTPATVPAFSEDEVAGQSSPVVSSEPSVDNLPVPAEVAIEQESAAPAAASNEAAPPAVETPQPAAQPPVKPSSRQAETGSGGGRESRAAAPRADDGDGREVTEEEPPADPGPTGPTGDSGPTGGTGATGPSGPISGGVDNPPPATDPGSGSGAPSGNVEPAPETPTDDTPSSPSGSTETDGTSGADTEGADPSQQGVASEGAAQVAATVDALTAAPEDSAGNEPREQNKTEGEGGVLNSIVVTQIVEKIPDWVAAALAGLSLITLAALGVWWRERRRRRFAEADAMVDELTGIANRKAFDRQLELEWRRAARYGRSLGLMVMDLDGFKQVNDIKGHAAGDEVLREVAQKLDGRMRDTDLVARIGGDEFAVICPETGINELMTIRRQLAEHATSGLRDHVGLSVGVAEYVPGDDDADSILARADESMYRVKRGESMGQAETAVA